MSAPIAAESGEATREHAAGEKLAQLPLDEDGQSLAGPAGSPLLEETLEVLAQHSMEHSVLGLPAYVRARSVLALAVDPLPG